MVDLIIALGSSLSFVIFSSESFFLDSIVDFMTMKCSSDLLSILSFFLLVRPPRSQSLLIMVWCSSKTEHRLRISLDSGPIFSLAIFTVRRWSVSPFFLSPLESPRFPVPCSSPVSSLSFASSPSVLFNPPPRSV